MPTEKAAWEAYREQAVKIFADLDFHGYNIDRLAVSFRMARQNAYTQGIMKYAATLEKQGKLHGLQYVTRDDGQVRWNHKAMHGVIQPINSEFWEVWLPLNGFNCRCYPRIITKAQAATDPQQFAFTDYNKEIKPDKGFYE
jgi:hypothetical protein